MNLNRVVITGVGALTPVGNNVPDFWNGLTNGVSGAAPITHFDTSKFKTQFACEVKNFNPTDFIDPKEARKLDPFAQYGIVAAEEAIKDADILSSSINRERVGVIWASGIGGMQTIVAEVGEFTKGDGTPRFNPFFIPKMISDIVAGHISIKYSFQGPNYATVSACASSANAIADAYNCIRLDMADLIVCGGSEAAINEAGVGGFNAMHALSTRNDDPKTASRPFDKDRDGFVLGEGAGGLILENLEHALARGATIYAEIVGVGLTADAHHITAPCPDGTVVARAMKIAVETNGNKLTDVNHINTHGTSTPVGDIAEIKGILSLFGEHTPNIAINSTKSCTGHLLGAAGAIESIATALAIKNNVVPPTINHFTDDENIDPLHKLNLVFGEKQQKPVDLALCNTFGFGGHNVSIAIKKYNV
ncbi:MAG: beta-ketoacyl-ACP synthase II [Bacteroidales bacterium]|jgi:3-oxoacyl-[acyl-carrier-protein] synthase II|nr:beta-ketoacyl-ACP synthase II [Bacteroidales bacterium]